MYSSMKDLYWLYVQLGLIWVNQLIRAENRKAVRSRRLQETDYWSNLKGKHDKSRNILFKLIILIVLNQPTISYANYLATIHDPQVSYSPFKVKKHLERKTFLCLPILQHFRDQKKKNKKNNFWAVARFPLG